MVFFLSSWQGPVQAALRPAMWIPGVNRAHSHREKWSCPDTQPGACVEELMQAVDRVQTLKQPSDSTYVISKVDREKFKVQVLNWTKAEWLDVVEIEFKHGQVQGTEAECLSFSSGFLPTWFPLCFLFNSVFCVLPFWDRGFNRNRLESLRLAMRVPCHLRVIAGAMTDPLIT